MKYFSIFSVIRKSVITTTKIFAQKLITELVDFNNGIADIGDSEGGLENYDNDKLNDWINQVMSDIVETNEAFNALIDDK